MSSLAFTFFIVQIHFQGVINCEKWTSSNIINKSKLIIDILVEHVRARCICDFPRAQINQSVFKCHAESPNYVTFRASIHAYLNLSKYYLVELIEDWISTQESAVILGEKLIIDKQCPTEITSFDDQECLLDEYVTANHNYILIASITTPLTVIIVFSILLPSVFACIKCLRYNYSVKPLLVANHC